MVEGKGFVGHVSNNRALLEHTLVQNEAERGPSRNQAQPGFCRATGHEYDEERDEQGSHVGHLRRRQCQFLFTARRSFRSFISTSNRSIRRPWTNFTSSRAAQRATP